MKKITLMLMCILAFGAEAGLAQTYMLTKSVLAQRVDINGDSLITAKKSERLEESWLLNVVTEANDFKVITHATNRLKKTKVFKVKQEILILVLKL